MQRPKCVQHSVLQAIGSKASTLLTNATSQESRRDPNTGGFQLLASGSKKQIPIIQREMALAGGINKNTRERSFIIPTNFIGHGYGGRLS